MATRTHSPSPFAPRDAITREKLLAYAEGKLTPAEQHEVELHLQGDPLLQDAADGLAEPGATTMLEQLNRLRPKPSGSGAAGLWIAGAAIVVIGAGVWLFSADERPVEERVVENTTVQHSSGSISIAPMEVEEIASASEQPARERIGHERLALHTREVSARVEREMPVERMDPRRTNVDGGPLTGSPAKAMRAHNNIQLLFPYDLKMVDPVSLYANEPSFDLTDEHVAARFADANARDSARSDLHFLPYTRFMEGALGSFSSNDHKGCLDDLRFLMKQYPDDVNALFYAGLCCYNLGLYDRARTFLHSAATHPIDVFDEEAAWYHALTLDRLGETKAAQEAYARIAAQDGFYSELARGRLE